MRTNVLYIFADQLSALALQRNDASGLKHTPNIDALAKRGVRFERGYCVTPQCSPSRASILTGLYPHRTGVIGNEGTPGTNDLDPNLPNLGSLLQQQGYHTAYFGKWHLGHSPINEYGFHETGTFSGDDGETSLLALDFLNRQAGSAENRPWLCVVSFNNPHDIYHIDQDIREEKEPDTAEIVLPESFFFDDLSEKPEAQRIFRDEDQGRPLTAYGEKQWRSYLSYYYRLIKKVDHLLGKVVECLKTNGQYENTLIVFTSDHGDLMASHRSPFKGPMMYEELVRIPLLLSWPGVIPEGEIREQLNINVDHLPTILDLLELPVPGGLDGISMREILFDDSAAGRDSMVLQYYSKQTWVNPIRTLLDGTYKYNLYRSGEEELYDLRADSGEIVNLADRKDFLEIKQRYKDALNCWIEEQKDPFFTYSRTDRQGNALADPVA
jgi:arylsulfatase A-like enzyme